MFLASWLKRKSEKEPLDGDNPVILLVQVHALGHIMQASDWDKDVGMCAPLKKYIFII